MISTKRADHFSVKLNHRFLVRKQRNIWLFPILLTPRVLRGGMLYGSKGPLPIKHKAFEFITHLCHPIAD